MTPGRTDTSDGREGGSRRRWMIYSSQCDEKCGKQGDQVKFKFVSTERKIGL